jgi:hypothetical protein
VPDPFEVLGLPTSATLADVRAARRRLAMLLHPDHGGDSSSMQDVNRAFDLAVRAVRERRSADRGAVERTSDRDAVATDDGWPTSSASAAAAEPSDATAVAHDRAGSADDEVPRAVWWFDEDRPSFTIDALPVVAYEALLEVAGRIGSVIVDDPPYLLDVVLSGRYACTCRVDIVPDAGSSTVSITVVGPDREHWPPAAEAVRDLWIRELNDTTPDA